MFNKIRRLIGAPFTIVTGVIFGLLIWLFYGEDDLRKFIGWLNEQAKAERLRRQELLRQKLAKWEIRNA